VRVGGGFPEELLACTGTGCQGVPPAPPIFAAPSSSTISGVDDVEPSSSKLEPKSKPTSVRCRKNYVKKKGKCVKRPGVKKRARKSNRRAK
jgi:hypothetical protein